MAAAAAHAASAILHASVLMVALTAVKIWKKRIMHSKQTS